MGSTRSTDLDFSGGRGLIFVSLFRCDLQRLTSVVTNTAVRITAMAIAVMAEVRAMDLEQEGHTLHRVEFGEAVSLESYQ